MDSSKAKWFSESGTVDDADCGADCASVALGVTVGVAWRDGVDTGGGGEEGGCAWVGIAEALLFDSVTTGGIGGVAAVEGLVMDGVVRGVAEDT